MVGSDTLVRASLEGDWTVTLSPAFDSAGGLRLLLPLALPRAASSASRGCTRCLYLLARPKRFELLTPKFVVYTTALIWHNFSANRNPK